MKRLTAVAALLLAMGASAGEFSVAPVRIFLHPNERAIAVTVVNEGSEELVMQSELYSWQQKADGSDDLQPTEDVVLSPPIVKLAPKARQVLRLARVGPAPTDREQTYRLIVREVPEAKPSTDRNPKVQMALAFSLPIFITPNGAKRQMDCEVQRASAQSVKVSCANTGRAYAQIRGISLASADGATLAARDVVGYILPDHRRSFDLQSTSALPAGKVKLQVAFDDGTTQSFDGALTD
jgi:fimbrial chaperone protein